ncbi:MAG: hypothetical protein KY438_10565, partial [Actinobacteria bacterium]|nr:hypothetical protein [Actinomycetota bacterium]
QPGSSFKPFVLATALEQGLSPQSSIDGRGPCRFPNPGAADGDYEAENFEGSAGGVVTLAQATHRSVNCAYVRLGLIAGLEEVAATAARMGITTPLDPVLSLPLGSKEVRPLDMAAAYATFAADGMHFSPYLVEEVLDEHGKVLFGGTTPGERAISEATARMATDVMSGVVSGGTATAARFPDGRPAAGKTGTTQANGDAWFAGYTPGLSTAVWMGYPEGQARPMNSVHGVEVTGGSIPADIFRRFMSEAVAGNEEVYGGDFVEPSSLDGRLLSGTRQAYVDPDAVPPPEPSTTTTAPPASTTTTTAPPVTTTTPTTEFQPTPTTLPPTVVIPPGLEPDARDRPSSDTSPEKKERQR